MVSALEGGHAYDDVAAKGRVIVPVLHIAADENPPQADIARLRAVVPEFHFGHVVIRPFSASATYRPRSTP
jgi:hypothetical protein